MDPSFRPLQVPTRSRAAQVGALSRASQALSDARTNRAVPLVGSIRV